MREKRRKLGFWGQGRGEVWGGGKICGRGKERSWGRETESVVICTVGTASQVGTWTGGGFFAEGECRGSATMW